MFVKSSRSSLVPAVCLPPFLVLTGAVWAGGGRYFAWDAAISRAIQSVRLPGFAELMFAVSLPGNTYVVPILIVSVIAAWLFRNKFPAQAWGLILSTAGATGINALVKLVIGRPRPSVPVVEVMVLETSHSFPSGHVMHYVGFYGYLFFLALVFLAPSWKRTLILLFCGTLVTLVGVSRVYLGAHWPSDVTGAYLLGGAWLSFGIACCYRWLNQSQRAAANPSHSEQTTT